MPGQVVREDGHVILPSPDNNYRFVPNYEKPFHPNMWNDDKGTPYNHLGASLKDFHRIMENTHAPKCGCEPNMPWSEHSCHADNPRCNALGQESATAWKTEERRIDFRNDKLFIGYGRTFFSYTPHAEREKRAGRVHHKIKTVLSGMLRFNGNVKIWPMQVWRPKPGGPA